MRTYRGRRLMGGCEVTVDGESLPLRLDLYNHSPTGFEWGFSGSGPAQLALAVLADYFAREEGMGRAAAGERAVRLHQRFKSMVVAPIKKAEWEMTSVVVAAALKVIEAGL